MKSLVMLAIVHSCQEPGNTQASDFEERLDYLRSKFDAQVILEEWADAEQSVTALGKEVGPPMGKYRHARRSTVSNIQRPYQLSLAQGHPAAS